MFCIEFSLAQRIFIFVFVFFSSVPLYNSQSDALRCVDVTMHFDLTCNLMAFLEKLIIHSRDY